MNMLELDVWARVEWMGRLELDKSIYDRYYFVFYFTYIVYNDIASLF